MIHPVDEQVGARIRNLRRLSGMTQQELGERVGIKFQQIQKYETGANRVSASRLWDISETLNTQVAYFFDKKSGEANLSREVDDISQVFAQPEIIELVRSYRKISEVQRRPILNLTRSLASNQQVS